jgi:2,5-dihydroxypyridine 5,6-dioxygenase
MISDRIDGHWIDAFAETLALCKPTSQESAIILSETHSRELNVHLAELALSRLGASFFHLVVPGAPPPPGPIVRSTGASTALDGQAAAVAALCQADFIVDLTIEGLMHAPQTTQILKSGARILNISNEHPEALARLVPVAADKDIVKGAVERCRSSRHMHVTSAAGTDLTVNMASAVSVGVWGWTDRAGTLAHWPGGIVVSFPAAHSVDGVLVLDAGDLNLTFKRYIENPVTLTLKDDHVIDIAGNGADAALMRNYLQAFDDPAAYATSHVGWGLSKAARYEALTMYDRGDTNCTELRAIAGNFLYSTGANEFAGRFTRGHFDLPVMNCTIVMDDEIVVENGTPV